jgi:hypothetical protein
MVGTYPLMDVYQKGLALLSGNTAELDSSFPAAVEFAVDQQVHFSLVGNPFRLYVIIGKLLILEVLQ